VSVPTIQGNGLDRRWARRKRAFAHLRGPDTKSRKQPHAK